MSLGKTLAAKLPLEALKMVIRSRNTDDLIRPPLSDKESSTAPTIMWTCLKPTKLKSAWAAKASLYDNATIESFFRTLKVEEVYINVSIWLIIGHF